MEADLRRRSVSRKAVPGKPVYLPPPPPNILAEADSNTSTLPITGSPKAARPTLANQIGSFDRPRSQTTRIIIKEGKKVASEQDFDFSGLENSQSLSLLDAFKKGKITKEQTIQFAKQITAANRTHNTEYNNHLFESLGAIPEKRNEPRQRSQTTAVAQPGLPTHVLEKLDDVQRKAILTSVAAGRLNIDEALGLVKDFYDAETRVSTGPSPESPIRPTVQASEEDMDRLCDAIGRTSSTRFEDRKSTIAQASLLSHFGLDEDDVVPAASGSLKSSDEYNSATSSLQQGAPSPSVQQVPFPKSASNPFAHAVVDPNAAASGSSSLPSSPPPVAPPRRSAKDKHKEAA